MTFSFFSEHAQPLSQQCSWSTIIVEISLACYDFSNLVYVCRSIGRRWFARFLCICKSSVVQKKSAHAEGARMMSDGLTLRTVTNGSTGLSSHVLNVSRGVTIGWMSAYIGHVLFRILLSVFPCYLARLHKRSASRRSFLRPLRTLFIIAIYYHTNITSSAWILLSVSASMCVPLCAIKVTSTFTPKIYAAEIKKGNFGIYAKDLRRRN